MLTATAGIGRTIEALGAIWMLHPEQFAASVEVGFAHPLEGYFAGRAGVLGDVDGETVAAVLAMFEPRVVARLWSAGISVHVPSKAARLYIDQAAEWAGRHLAGADGLDRFRDLSDRVIDAAPAAGLPLFAGWRRLPRVEDGPGRALQNALVLRELWFGVHVSALTVAGIGAVESHLLNRGEQYCASMGWAPPYPDVSGLAAAYAEVGDRTTRRMAALLGATLAPAEIEELAQIATALHARVAAADPR